MRNWTLGSLFVVMAAGALGFAAPASDKGLVVHEWGTFLAMNGSDGVTLDGMYHEEHALPGFVHARRTSELRLPGSNLKGETPVIYFYTNTPTRVNVQVGFPSGVWTQWYPQASYVGPTLVQTGSLMNPRNGRIGWMVDVIPPSMPHKTPPATDPDALWKHTRDVDAAFVSPVGSGSVSDTSSESERFIFYRGLGDARLPLTVSATGGARLTCGAGLTSVKHVYVLRVENGQGVYRYLPSLECDKSMSDVVPTMTKGLAVSRFADTLADDMAARLVDSGLYAKEARAMVNTWRTSYFTSDGVRVLFVLPQSWTDKFIPMTITPAPAELVRVMVGRIELLTASREYEAEAAISNLASPDSRVRESAFAFLREQGRYVEPIIRRTLQTTKDERVRVMSRRLLTTDFVTDLRSAINDAADGSVVPQATAFTRAQLASLLREVGLENEARAEGELALAALAEMPRPKMTDHASRNTYRAWARASEGVGKDADALQWYGEFVEFGSTFNTCSGCHSLAGPRDNSFFRDWWAGRRFGELAVRTGEAHAMIDADERRLKEKKSDLLSLIRLAYLYEARGDSARAAQLWTQVDGRNVTAHAGAAEARR